MADAGSTGMPMPPWLVAAGGSLHTRSCSRMPRECGSAALPKSFALALSCGPMSWAHCESLKCGKVLVLIYLREGVVTEGQPFGFEIHVSYLKFFH